MTHNASRTQRSRVLGLACLAGLAFSLSGALPAEAQKPLRLHDKQGSIITIDRSGQYRLAEDLLGCRINITASDVTIEFDGHTLDQSPSPEFVGVYARGVGNVRLLGPGTIRGYLGNHGRAIEFVNVQRSQVVGLTLTNNIYGVVVDQDFSTPVYDPSTENLFIGNQVTNNGEHGFTMHGADRNLLVANNCSNNGQIGISLIIGSGNVFFENTLSGNFRAGIELAPEFGAPATSNNRIENNIATGNGIGIRLTEDRSVNVTGTFVTGNTATGNTTADLADFNFASGTCLNNWMANVFGSAAGAVDCIH